MFDFSLMHDHATGRHACCICFEFFDPARLFVDWDGQTWDICWGCQASQSPTGMTWPG